jgi:hypothetical protein
VVLDLFVEPLAKLQDNVCALEIARPLYYLAKIVNILIDISSTLEKLCGLEVGP